MRALEGYAGRRTMVEATAAAVCIENRRAFQRHSEPTRRGRLAPCRRPDQNFPHEALAQPSYRRQPLAILAIDMAGYSEMVETDDLRTALRVRHLQRHLIRPATRLYAGWVFSVAGDGIMAAFPAAAAAVVSAVAIQRALDLLEGDGTAEGRIRVRMGISFGSVLQVDGELYGRPLNVAARLEAIAEPGAIYVSGAVFDRVGGLPGAVRMAGRPAARQDQHAAARLPRRPQPAPGGTRMRWALGGDTGYQAVSAVSRRCRRH